MDNKQTLKMDSQPETERASEATVGGAAPGESATTLSTPPGASPFVPLRPVDPPTPRPGQPGAALWTPQPAYGPGAAGQPGAVWEAARRDDATVLVSQRPSAVFAWLVVMDGPDQGRIHQLRPDVTTVGRSAANDVVLADDAASSQHLKIKREILGAEQSPPQGPEEQYTVIDLASSNGTFVGNKATCRDRDSRVYRHVLRDGDYLLLGETTLVFKQV